MSESYTLTVKPYAVLAPNGDVRHLAVHAVTHQVLHAPSLYAAHLQVGNSSPNSIRNATLGLAHLYSWAETAGIDVEARLLRGQGLLPHEVNAFTYALMRYRGRAGKRLHSNTVASILLLCRQVSRHCISLYRPVPALNLNNHKVSLAALLQADEQMWRGFTPRRVGQAVNDVSDLTDKEIAAIEGYLNPEVRITAGERPEVAFRNYLLWRLCIGLGLRLGESLALRLQDCDHETIRIVRIEDRKDPPDPRGKRAPRPKTLGRELGVLGMEPVLPQLISAYEAMHRFYRRRTSTESFYDWDVGHDYLLLEHTSGGPFTYDGASYVARKIREATGITNFHWHLPRHSFFNRMYDDIADADNHDALLTDMQYWGGWSNPRSLYIYTKRSIAERARRRNKIRQDELRS